METIEKSLLKQLEADVLFAPKDAPTYHKIQAFREAFLTFYNTVRDMRLPRNYMTNEGLKDLYSSWVKMEAGLVADHGVLTQDKLADVFSFVEKRSFLVREVHGHITTMTPVHQFEGFCQLEGAENLRQGRMGFLWGAELKFDNNVIPGHLRVMVDVEDSLQPFKTSEGGEYFRL